MNVLWIQTDEQRPDSLGCYGSTWARTPHLDRLAREGVVFENAVCQAPVCGPSRSSQLSARYPQSLGCLSNRGLEFPFPEGTVTFPEALARAGYRTASFGKRHTMRMPRTIWQEGDSFQMDESVVGSYGLPAPYDEAAHEVIKRPGGTPIILAGHYPDVPDNPSAHVTDAALKFLSGHDRKRPFFLRASHLFPHTPVLPPVPWNRIYRPEDLPIDGFNAEELADRPAFDRRKAALDRMDLLKPEEVRQVWRDYMGLCAYVDSEVGRLLRGLEEMGLSDDTLVLFSSDHGKALGEWGAGEKDTFDHEVWRVPFIWWRPGLVPAGVRRSEPCELLDTARTLFGLLGLSGACDPHWAGRDLFSRPENDHAFGIIRPDWIFENESLFRAAVRTERWRMDVTLPFSGESPNREKLDGGLYDLASDPRERRNLFHRPELRATAESLLVALRDWLEKYPLEPRLRNPSLAGKLY